MELHVETVKSAVKLILEVLRMYDWLLDLYVLDFYVDNHWEKLPSSWRKALDSIDPPSLGDIIVGKPTKHVIPLSLLALLNIVKALSIPRESSSKLEPKINPQNLDNCASHPRLKNMFLKHVKLKKRHEISRMADVVADTALKSNCKGVIDFGSGLGHLVRMLGYKYELHAAGIECQRQLTEEARKLDQELEYTVSKHLSPVSLSKLQRPTHLNMTLTSHKQLEDISLPFSKEYGLIGLHPCGDLGPLLLKHFVEKEKVKFICVVGCCYMKLTSNGYPMSGFMRNLDSDLSYVSREVACHAIEVHCERLGKGNYEDLKIHAYRAGLELLLQQHDPKLRHGQVRSVKHRKDLSFESYCTLALDRLNTPLPPIGPAWDLAAQVLVSWARVVTVYSLRLALAPLVESLVLLDRVLYCLENDLSCEIRAVFDPKMSPRNHIIIARRK